MTFISKKKKIISGTGVEESILHDEVASKIVKHDRYKQAADIYNLLKKQQQLEKSKTR